MASLKTLRRWLIVAGVWAVAATAIAVFALVKADEADDAGREQAAGDLDRVQRQLDSRIDELPTKTMPPMILLERIPGSERGPGSAPCLTAMDVRVGSGDARGEDRVLVELAGLSNPRTSWPLARDWAARLLAEDHA